VMIFLSGSFLLYGHGIQLTIIKKYPCIIVNAKYHGSQGLAHAEVIVRFETEKKEFQSGKTDKNGIFCFYPDQTGKWTIKVDDAMGHRSTGEVAVENDFFEVLPKPTETGEEVKTPGDSQPLPGTQKVEDKSILTQNDTCCHILKIVLGVLLILVITFILHHWKKQKENKKDKNRSKK
ncbi:MAG: nickel transport protein, partial [Acidobacteriota bacterium]|nr:nickel transport protein [Acidobacteriota bacterium]